jgi:hypothetical protein
MNGAGRAVFFELGRERFDQARLQREHGVIGAGSGARDLGL